jgi:asparagine synthase (glutamine-hydrolysing)
MCGIAGILKVNLKPVTKTELKCMTDVISYRGPDGEGCWISQKQNIGLAHRRLSIIDLSDNAKQPMHYANDRYTITFNGEIYNYIELKKKLLSKGYVFLSDSDTEVILALYDQKKEKCLDELDGMFSFAIWDELEQELFCARDRFGEKPFHYYFNGNEFVFCSEIKQFWAYGIRKKVNETKLTDFIVSGSIDDRNDITATFYDDIKRLDAACYLKIKTNGQITIKKYWDINLQVASFTGKIDKAAELFLDLLRESVNLRLRSDVPVGSSLSGGIDSSSIVTLIDQLKDKGQKQNTFSARFKDFGKDEGSYIEEVIKKCDGLNVSYTWPDEDYFLKVIDKVIYHQDEPFASASIVAQYAVMELAKTNNITVLLDGQGADEYLAGYLPYYNLYLNQLFYNDRKLYRSEMKHFNSFHGGISMHTSLEDRETLGMKLGRYKRKLFDQPMPIDKYSLKTELKSDTTLSGLKTLLRYSDRNSMAHSREVRLPFLSHKLVEFAFSLPDNFLLRDGWTKFILRKSMENILPQKICWRVDKIGYEAPQNKWLASNLIRNEVNEASKKFNDLNIRSSKNNDAIDWRLFIANKYS